MNAILLFQRSQLGNSIHPFVSFEVAAFAAKCEKVYLVCLEYNCPDDDIRCYENVIIKTVTLKSIKMDFISILGMLNKYGLEDLKHANDQKVPLYEYIKSTLQVIMFGHSLAQKAIDIIEESIKDEWIIEGYWLSGPAYAAALIKDRFPNIKCIARAHSSEIDRKRNLSAVCQMKSYIHSKLDMILFISLWGENEYKEIMRDYGIDDFAKCKVSRLGVIKQLPDNNSGSKDNVFRILTVSRIVSLKRLDLLIDALKLLKDKYFIEWTHIGDGPDKDLIIGLSEDLPENISLRLLGSMPNTSVHSYLSKSPVDLFINVSSYEGLPVSIMEAFAYGIPALATDAGGTSELVNSSNGLLIPVDIDSHILSKSIETFINNVSISDMKKNAFLTWKMNYDKEKNYEEFFELISHD